MSKERNSLLRELSREYGAGFSAKNVRQYYHKQEKLLAEKRGSVNRKRKIEMISLRERMSLALAEEFVALGESHE